jgi:hypothetical protein
VQGAVAELHAQQVEPVVDRFVEYLGRSRQAFIDPGSVRRSL